MPKLSRLRFVSIGHLNARFDDLTLNLCDDDGRATDTVLWLRNGGGKSSLLNLFYSGIRPHQREFLGSREDKKELKEYVNPNDRAVVLYEWELDGKSGQLGFEDDADRFLTGAFYEHRNGKLKRLFFSCRVSREHTALTLEGLPIFRRENGTAIARRSLSSFREEWSALQRRLPGFQVTHTESHEEWRATLNSAGIDTELFRYQLTMNRREGGADELFRFTSHEAFVDFLLELVLDPSLSSRVQKNIEQHRKDLRRRVQHYKPESELLEGLMARLAPMQAVTDTRAALHVQAGTCGADIRRFIDHADRLVKRFTADSDACTRRQAEHSQLADQLAQQHVLAVKQAATLRHVGAILNHADAMDDKERKNSQFQRADRLLKAWNAAIPLRNALRFERKAQQNRVRLRELQDEHQPLHDMLCAAADRYASALTRVINDDRDAIRRTEGEKQDLQRQIAQARHEMMQVTSAIATLETQIQHVNAKLGDAASERATLVQSGLLSEQESGSAAILRWTENVQVLRVQIADTARTLDAHRLSKEEQAKEQVCETNKAQRFQEKLEYTQCALKEANEWKERLETNELLLEILQVDRLRLSKLTQASWQLLKDEAEELLNSLVSLRIAKVADERAIHHLEQVGLLPPSRDVEQLLQLLKPRVRAWSGWEFISRNYPTDPRAAVAKVPHLATGVVVHEPDFDLAADIIHDSKQMLDSPIVVATRKGFDDTSNGDQLVIGPHSDAYFDRAAGVSEGARRQTALEQYDHQISSLKQRHQRLRDLEAELGAFSDHHPPSWFNETTLQIEELAQSESDSRQLASDLQQEVDDLTECIKSSESSLEQLRRREQSACETLRTIEHYVECYEARLEDQRSELSRLSTELELAQLQDADIRNRAASLEESIGDRDDSLRLIQLRYNQNELLLTLIEYRQSGASVDSDAPLSQLASDYRQFKQQYEQKVGSQGLLQLVQENEGNAQRERTKFRRHLDSTMSEDDVRHVLDSLSDPEDAEEHQQKAQKRRASAFSAYQTSSKSAKAASERVDETRKCCQAIDAPVEMEAGILRPDAEFAERAADEAELSALDLERQSKEHWDKAQEAERSLSATVSALRTLNGLLGRASGLRDRHQRLLESFGEICPANQLDDGTATSIPDEIDLIEECFQSLERRIDGVSDESDELNKRRAGIVSEIRRWAGNPRFDQLKTKLIHRIRSYDDIDFERSYDHLHQLVELRQKTVNEKIAEVDESRELVIRQLQQVAEDGYGVLRSAANQSKLPESVPELAGRQFLTISMKWPEGHGEQRARIGDLIDELVEGDEIPGSTKLMQLAVRRLARPIRVRVLNPDPNHAGQRLDISDLSKFSGGERLTCAVLLYCTLAQLRAKSRGLFRKQSSVLLLDNPIGSASRVTFIKLQRDVARAMGIQLVYTTGVNDYEALQPIPKRIRLRNDRVDRRNGNHMVELMNDESPSSEMQPIQAVHVGEREIALQ